MLEVDKEKLCLPFAHLVPSLLVSSPFYSHLLLFLVSSLFTIIGFYLFPVLMEVPVAQEAERDHPVTDGCLLSACQLSLNKTSNLILNCKFHLLCACERVNCRNAFYIYTAQIMSVWTVIVLLFFRVWASARWIWKWLKMFKIMGTTLKSAQLNLAITVKATVLCKRLKQLHPSLILGNSTSYGLQIIKSDLIYNNNLYCVA